MACPWFQPVSPLGISRAIMPLGDAWAGECRAPGEGHAAPERSALLEWCNLGYARGRCPRFPDGGGPDAVRFSVVRDLAAVVTVCCVREKDYLPFDRVSLVWSVVERRFLAPHPDSAAGEQAKAYLASYLRRKERP